MASALSVLGFARNRLDADTLRRELDSFLASVEARALRMAEIRLHDRDSALDAVQDAMIKLTTNYAHKPEEEWAPLFFRILQNCIIDQLRGQQRRARVFTPASAFEDSNIENLDAARDDIERQHGDRDTLERIEAAVRELPRRQQEVVMLRIWQGLTVTDTAKAMGCGEGSVKTHLSRALGTLRNRLGECLQ